MNEIFCSNCGKQIEADAKFCKYCGGAQGSAANEPQLVTNLPKQAQRNPIDYINRRHLSMDSIVFFIFTYISRTILILLLIIIGAVLLEVAFIFGLFVYFACIVVISLLVHNNFYFSVDQDGLKIEQGILFKRNVSVPYEQIQNVNLNRTILDRILGFSRVSVETAGSAVAAATNTGAFKSTAEAYIPGLHVKEAQKVHDLLIDGVDGVHGN